ncbi:MAG: GNAT family N-acetyltransferase [Phycisphaerae bacterium]|nr:GNAT family N-acetyltransferase [Phycisphaerae bacterium]
MIRIRRAEPNDLPTVLELIHALAEYEREPDAVKATLPALERHLFGNGFGRGPTCECLMGELDGRVEGFAVFCTNFSTWLAKPGIWLEDLFVRPAARGRGLGKALLIDLARLAVERDCGRVEWSVLDWNAPSIAFYRSLGAVALDEWTTNRLTGEALQALAASPVAS